MICDQVCPDKFSPYYFRCDQLHYGQIMKIGYVNVNVGLNIGFFIMSQFLITPMILHSGYLKFIILGSWNIGFSILGTYFRYGAHFGRWIFHYDVEHWCLFRGTYLRREFFR